MKAIKKEIKVQYRILDHREVIKTDLDKTQKQGEVGDVVVTGPLGETYVIDHLVFNNKYVVVNKNTAVSKRNEIEFRFVDKVTTLVASWGEKMTIPKGGAIVIEGGVDSYGIHPKAFKETYDVVS